MSIIDENKLKIKIREAVKTEIDDVFKIKENIDALYIFMSEIKEQIKVLETKKMNFDDEKMIDDYLADGLDRARDDAATEVVDEETEGNKKSCECCLESFNEDELDFIDNCGSSVLVCKNCEHSLTFINKVEKVENDE